MYKIVKINELNEETIKEWKELWNLSKNKNYFNSFEWFENYTSTFSIKQFILLKGYSTKGLEFILPLIYVKKNNLKCIGGKYLDKVSFLYNDNPMKCIDNLKRYAKENHISITLYECDFNTCFLENKDCIIEFASDNPYVDLNQNLDNVIKSKEKRYIKNIIRKNNEVNFKIIVGKNAQNYIETIFDIENRSNKPKLRKALFIDDKSKNLFRKISQTKYGMLCILYYNGLPIAHMLGLIVPNQTFMAYHMAYDKQYRKYQPGKLVIYHLLNYLKNQSYSIFDFSRGNSILKRHFSIENAKHYNIYINPNLNIKIHFIYKKNIIFLKKNIKKILKRLGLWKK